MAADIIKILASFAAVVGFMVLAIILAGSLDDDS